MVSTNVPSAFSTHATICSSSVGVKSTSITRHDGVSARAPVAAIATRARLVRRLDHKRLDDLRPEGWHVAVECVERISPVVQVDLRPVDGLERVVELEQDRD